MVWSKKKNVICYKAKGGSGGIGCFVRTQILQTFKVDIFNSSNEGIMWLHFQPITDAKATISVYVINHLLIRLETLTTESFMIRFYINRVLTLMGYNERT